MKIALNDITHVTINTEKGRCCLMEDNLLPTVWSFGKMNGKQTKDTFNEPVDKLFFCGKKKKMKSRKFADSLSSKQEILDRLERAEQKQDQGLR